MIDDLVSNLATLAAFVIFCSGLDELVMDLLFLFRRRAGGERARLLRDLGEAPEKPIAVFVPAWHEEDVIGEMLAHFVETVDYRNYHLLVGVYPNDPGTLRRVEEVSQSWPNVHAVSVGHPGLGDHEHAQPGRLVRGVPGACACPRCPRW